MFREKKPDDLVTYVGHVLHPHVTCPGNVEVWDQTLGCDTCGKTLWGGDARAEDEFYAEHPFILWDAHDSGDESPDAWDTVGGYVPLGGWRFPDYPPQWHDDPPRYSWPSASLHAEDRARRYVTEHVFPVDTWSNHDPGDEA